ncbi:MAG TPA: tetratricopeptide repeat protein [Thermoanaerobaculia bacterium]
MTTPASPAAACPDPETLAAFGEGRLSRRQVAELAEHLERCEDCVATLAAVNETIATREAAPAERKSRPWWLAAVAAAVAIVAIAIGVRVSRDEPAATARLIELMPASARLVEARPTGGFPWKSYRGPMRADDTDADPQRMRLIGTAGEIVAAADRDRSAAAQQAAGVALVMVDKPLQAVDRLQAAAKAAPDDAGVWNDLAVAQYSAALRLTRPSLLPEALASADRALRIEPRHAEARFNRALILEHLGLSEAAREAWQRYLEVDPGSPWAAEARQRLARIAAAKTESDAQRTRTYAEAETLARWAEAAQRGDDGAARQELDRARTVGDGLAAARGESLLRDAVRAIDGAAPAARATLADAHLTYRRGRIAYSRRQLEAAVRDLDRAAASFLRSRSPMALVARYYAASARFDRNEVAGARDALQALLAEAEARPPFIALGAQVRWQLALTRMVDGDWSGALPLLVRSRDAFARLDERNHLGFLESLLADTLLSLGRLDEAWDARIRGFTLLSGNDSGDRMHVSLKAAAQMELRSGRLTTARALLDLARTGSPPSDAIAADILTHAALVNVALDDREEAQRALGDAAAATGRIRDDAARQLAQAHLDLAGAAFCLRSDPARATEMLTRAIDRYRAGDRTVFLPECFLLRARAGGADPFADLDSGIAALERSRAAGGAVVGTGVLNAGTALYQDAIRLSADRGDLERAFTYAERSRAQPAGTSVSTVSELQERLRGSDTAVLQVIALPGEVVSICVTGDEAAMERRPFRSSADLHADLYAAVIRPFDALLAGRRHLIVVADRALSGVAFAALYDSTAKRHLIERMAVSTAMSASALRPMQRSRAPGALLAVALPSGDAAGLPDSLREVDDVHTLYANAVTIPPEHVTFDAFAAAAAHASVIHLAGHTQRPSEDDGTALVFARDRVTWRTIADRRLPHAPTVVLAACNTLRSPASANVRAPALGEGFLAAGAADVIGTLTPIADADARELFHSVQRRLAAGEVPAEALRGAQLEAIAQGSSAWRAVASLTRCITVNVKRS